MVRKGRNFKMSKTFKILILILIITGIVFGFGLDKRGVAQEELPLFEYKELRKPGLERYVSDEIIVKFKPDVPAEKINEIYQREQIPQEKYVSPYAGFRVLKIPAGKTVEEMVYVFQKNPLVDYAEPNFYAYTSMVPNDPYYVYQWHFDDDHTYNNGSVGGSNPYGGANGGGIRMEEAWNITTGSSSVIVAVVDTGIRIGTDLVNTCFVQGYDFINNDTDPIDDNGHGTHVAGTIAQRTNNGAGVAGIAFSTCLMPVKVLNAAGSGTYQQVADGIMYATNNGAKVINLSLGGSSPSATLENAVAYAYNQGVTVLAASGNDNTSDVDYPARYNNYVIAVGATRYDEQKADYSNYGTSLDIAAPGGQNCVDSFARKCVTNDQNGDGYADGVLQQTFTIRGATITWGYYFFNGTSMSTPHVAGVAALILAQNPTFTPDQVRQRLQTTAEDKGTTGWDQYYGYGIVDAYAALTYTPPAVSISLTTDGVTPFGILPLGTTIDTTPTGTNDVQTVSVDVGPAKLDIKTTLFSDGTNNWTLGESNGGNQVIWEYSKEGTTWNKFLIANNLYLFENNVPQSATRNLYLKLTMPTSTASSNQYSSTVTIVATAP